MYVPNLLLISSIISCHETTQKTRSILQNSLQGNNSSFRWIQKEQVHDIDDDNDSEDEENDSTSTNFRLRVDSNSGALLIDNIFDFLASDFVEA